MASVVALTELLQLNIDGSPVSWDNPIPVAPENITGKFRESFENFVPGVNWNLTTGSGDIVQTDGNAVSASYLVVSKDPLQTATETILTYTGSFPMPAETSVGLSMSQRTLGQELSMEMVSTETPLPPVADIAISSISQTTTTLTVNTTAAHGLVPGKRIGIRGCVDSRLNYPSLVVASTPTATQITATAGPGGTIPSGTLSGGAVGFVYFRSALGNAQNGLSEIFENASATNASFYVRSSAGDVLPSGTAGGNQSLTVSTTASIQAIVSPYTYAFLPSSEYRMNLQADRAQFYDVGIDSTSSTTSRQLRTQVVPDPTKEYTLRFRMTNVDSLTVPTAKIVSVSKSGTTTATVTTAEPHGLTTSDQIVTYGVRDTVNFAAITVQVAVASVINSTQFTVVWGSAVTATSYGGMVARVQGANVPAPFNQGSNGSINSAQGANGELILIASNGYTSFLIGDYVNLYGLRDNSTGADLGLDGAYKVVDFTSNNARVIPIGSTPAVGTFGATACGGLIIKRTDARIAFVRIFDYLRERVEIMARPSGDASAAVTITGSASVSVSSGTINVVNNNSYALQSSTNLAANATFTGTTQNIAATTTSTSVYNAQLVIGVNHTAGLVPGQLFLDLGTETTSTAPTVFYQALAVPIPSNANWQQFSVPISTRYYRLRFVNGATAQTNFRLSSFLTYNGGALSNPYSFPTNLQYALSTTNLAISATFTSATLDFGDTMNIYQSITAIVFADQASAANGLQIQVSRDGTNWRIAAQVAIVASTFTTLNAQLFLRYARIVYINGGVAQTSFALDAQVESQ